MQKDNYIRIRLTERQKNQIKQIAESEDISMSQYVLDLIKKDIKKRTKNKNWEV